MRVKELKELLENCNDEAEIEFSNYEYDERGIEYYEDELVFDSLINHIKSIKIILI